MTCGRCPEGRRFAEGSTYCVLYGMIIRDGHECKLEGGRRNDAAGHYREESGAEAEIPDDSGGAA